MAKKQEIETEETIAKKRKRMIYMKDGAVLFPVWAILTIEKSEQLFEKPRAHWEFGIIINRQMDGGLANSPLSEKCVWYETEEARDRAFNNMIAILSEENYNIITI